jgi:hypothetical protein
VEFFEGRPRLSTVLTLGWSSWIVADLPAGTDEVILRASRRGEAVEVRYSTGSGPAELAALVFLPPDRELLAGICCASPEGGGFTVNFHELRIAGRDWAAAGSSDWAGGPPGQATGWGQESAVPATGWGEEPAVPGPDWAGGEAAASPPGWAAEQAASRPAIDWSEPPPSAAAQDWAQLSQRVARGRDAGREPESPAGPAPAWAAAGDSPGDSTAEQASTAERTSTAEQASTAATGESPARALADDTTDPALPAASGEAGQNGDQPDPGGGAARAKPGGKAGGRGKAKARPDAAGSADAADEWISLLTADPADEQPEDGG